MHTVMLLNPKGGSGKTTIATNLAAYFAARSLPTALFDHDAQGSSTCWLAARPSTSPGIYGVAAFRNPAGVTRSWQLRVPLGTRCIIVDTPAGLTHPYLANLVRRADSIVIPVLASPIDMRAVGSFVDTLRRMEPVCKRGVRICAVLNRVRARGCARRDESESVLDGLGLQVVARLREAPCYLRASSRGQGVHELGRGAVGRRLEDWTPLLSWLEDGSARGDRSEPAPWPLAVADAPLPA